MSHALLFVVMALASYRLWRFVGLDQVPGSYIRTALMRRSTWDTVTSNTWKKALDLVTCPWCLGSWVSFGVVAVAAQLVSIPLPVLWAFAVAAVVGLIGSNLDG